MSTEAKGAIGAAANLAAHRHRRSIQSADLAQVLVASGFFGQFLNTESLSEILRRLAKIPGEEPVFGMPVDVYVYSDPVKRILAYALEEAQRTGEAEIRVVHLIVGLLVERECAPTRLLQAVGVDLAKIRPDR